MKTKSLRNDYREQDHDEQGKQDACPDEHGLFEILLAGVFPTPVESIGDKE